MLSFSTKGSAQLPSPRKLPAATALARQRAEEDSLRMEIDGEMQADTALLADLAERKAPNSLVAGRANVLIFPDLNSGNIAAKLVQYLAGAETYGSSSSAWRNRAPTSRAVPSKTTFSVWPPSSGCRLSNTASSIRWRRAQLTFDEHNHPAHFRRGHQQNDGKTTVALGLFAALRKRLGRNRLHQAGRPAIRRRRRATLSTRIAC
jgi:hypothetical protein